MAVPYGDRPRAKAPQKRKSPQQSQQSAQGIDENEGSSAAAGSSLGAGTGSAVEANSSEQRLQAVNVTKPVVPLKNIQFLQLNSRSGRGFQGRSPVEEGNAEANAARGAEKSNVNVGKFAMQQQLTNSDQQLKERQRLIN